MVVEVTVDQIETAGFTAWSPDERTEIDGWTVSSSGGYTRRLNSAVAVGAASASLDTRDRIAAWLAERNAGLTVRVTPLLDTATAAVVEETWGLARADETVVMAKPPSPAVSDVGVQLVDPADPAFEADLMHLNGRAPWLLEPWRRIVSRIGTRAIGMWIPEIAVGFAAETDGIASVFSVAVEESRRRSGHATAVMAAAETWAAARGAGIVFLQVLGTNDPARALYTGLGYTERYRYHYLQQPSS